MDTPQLRQALMLVFCDIVGTTRLMAQEGDLVAASALREFFERTGPLAATHRCLVCKFIGDGFLAGFDDPARALPFVRSIQDLLHTAPGLVGRNLGFRFSLHAAEVLCIETSYGKDVFGEGVNVVARLNNLAEPGEIVISQAALDRLPRDQQAQAGPSEEAQISSGRGRRQRGRPYRLPTGEAAGRDRHRHRRRSEPGAGSDIMIHRIALLTP